MLGAFDLVVHDQTIGEVDRLMGAKAIGAEDLVVRRAVERIGATGVVEAAGAFLLDVVEAAGRNPTFS